MSPVNRKFDCSTPPNCFSITPDVSPEAEELFAQRYAIASPHMPYGFIFSEVIFNLLESLFPGRKDLRVLDIGGGTGWFVAQFLRTYPKGSALLVDGVPCFCKEAARRLSRFKGRVTVLNASIESVAEWWPENTFDVITMNNVLHFIEPQFLSPLFRACTNSIGSSGVCFATGNMHAPEKLASAYGTAYAEFYDQNRMTQTERNAIHRVDQKIETLRSKGDSTAEFACKCVNHSLQGIMRRMKQAGFLSVDCCWKTCNAATVVATMQR